MALQYVNDQTHDICEQAINQDGHAIQYVINPTLELYRLAYQKVKDAMMIYVNFNKFSSRDIIGEVDTKCVEVKVPLDGLHLSVDKIVYKDSTTGKYVYIEKKDTIIDSILHHNHIKYNRSQIDSVNVIVNDKNQDVNMLIVPNESMTESESSFHVVQVGETYELYKQYS